MPVGISWVCQASWEVCHATPAPIQPFSNRDPSDHNVRPCRASEAASKASFEDRTLICPKKGVRVHLVISSKPQDRSVLGSSPVAVPGAALRTTCLFGPDFLPMLCLQLVVLLVEHVGLLPER
jgi:hypothetical protein